MKQANSSAGAVRSWGDVEIPTDGTFEELLAAEEEAGRRDPYRAVAAFTHTLAVRLPG